MPRLVSAVVNFYTMRGREIPISAVRLLLGDGGAITQFIIGLGIFLGSQGLVNFLKTIRTAGLKREDDYNENE